MTPDRFIGVISFFRQEVANRPFLLFVGLLLLCGLAGMRQSRQSDRRPRDRAPSLIAMAAIAAYAAIVIWYVGQEQYADAAEPTIAAVATLFDAGRPVYHDLDSAERYAHIYGPVAFIIPAWSFSLLGGSIVISKVPGALAGLLSVVAIFVLLDWKAERGTALRLTGLFVVLCLAFQQVSFWIRPDSFELFAAVVGLAAAVRIRADTAAGALIGLATGLLAGLKMTGPVYALPAFALLVADRRMRAIGLALPVAAIVCVLPFVTYDNVSFPHYIAWLRTSARNGLQFSTLKQNVEWLLFLLVPLVPSLTGRSQPRERWLYGSLVAGMSAVALAAAKPGAGPYHLLPFVPAVVYALAASARGTEAVADPWHRRGLVSYVACCGIIAFLQIAYLGWSTTRTPGSQLAADLRRLIAAHPAARMEMGYSGANEAFVFVRPILVFQQRDYLFDAPAIQEHQLSRLAFPEASVRAVENCRADVWILPRGGEPFTLRNRYPATGEAPLFPDAIRSAFSQTYRQTATTEFFDVWTCQRHDK
jgi:hypothetical protein